MSKFCENVEIVRETYRSDTRLSSEYKQIMQYSADMLYINSEHIIQSQSITQPVVMRLFGTTSITVNNREAAFKYEKPRALLVYMVMEGDSPLERGSLANMFWPDKPMMMARQNIRQSLLNCKRTLADHFEHVFSVSRARIVKTNNDVIWCDALEFKHHLWRAYLASKENDIATERHHLQVCLGLYRGQFVGHTLPNVSSAFNAWVQATRQSYQYTVSNIYQRLANLNE